MGAGAVNGFVLGSSAISMLAGILMMTAPHVLTHRNGMEPENSVEAIRTYRISGVALILLAFILIV